MMWIVTRTIGGFNMNDLCMTCSYCYYSYGTYLCEYEGDDKVPDEYYEDEEVYHCELYVEYQEENI